LSRIRGDAATGSGRVGGLRIVDEADTLDVADELEAVLDAGERPQGLRDRVLFHAGGQRGRGRCGGVLAVVSARNERLGRKLVVGSELDAVRASGDGAEATRDDGHVGFGLVLEDAQLGFAVGVVRAVTVEMIGLEVQQDRNAWAQPMDVLELEARQLAHNPGVPVECAVEARQRTADVARDRDRPAVGTEHRAEQLARRRLAVRAGDADERVPQQAKAELDLAPDRDSTDPCSRHQGRCPGHARALDQQLDAVQQAFLLIPRVDFDAGFGKPAGLDVGRTVGGDRRHATPGQRERGGLAGAGEPQHERPARKLHGFRASSEGPPSSETTVTSTNPASVSMPAPKFNADPVEPPTDSCPPGRSTRKNSEDDGAFGRLIVRTASTLSSGSGSTSDSPTR
jgi:hypothetical protein